MNAKVKGIILTPELLSDLHGLNPKLRAELTVAFTR